MGDEGRPRKTAGISRHSPHHAETIWSTKDKKLVMIELTVPWETRCDEAYER
ncbi:hypothetical protein DPMN_025953 [Dreissena polymorpha]|uniref:Uncharacterized protein n=1 Tax=Dreissena polymorpha TaxID=45954 RepID=A0A9D4LSI9_DREPO|nr:hypothetical protein DPMN_025953 [Dreissena polymorpha]